LHFRLLLHRVLIFLGVCVNLFRPLFGVLLMGLTAQALCAPAKAPEPDWESQVKQADAALWQATNTCDFALLKRTMTKDVEFYHDFVGVTTGNDQFVALMKRSVCKLPNEKVRRQAIEGTIHIDILHKFVKGKSEVYGAIVQGEHSFTVSYDGEPEEDSGSGHFFNTLRLTKDGWQVARMVSYRHIPAKESK
jgi:hypothetical protein